MTPALDALIPIRHQGPINDYNVRVRDYVPPEHKRFLEYLDVSPSLRELIVDYKSEQIIEKFNSFIEAYAEQRSKHIQVRYQLCVFLLGRPIFRLSRHISCFQHQNEKKIFNQPRKLGLYRHLVQHQQVVQSHQAVRLHLLDLIHQRFPQLVVYPALKKTVG